MPRILVIDDEQSVLEVIQGILTRFGHRVVTAADGFEGIQKYDADRFDMVITDMCMPGLDGQGVIEHIRSQRGCGTPIIAISGTPWMVNDCGFDLMLAKPFPLKELLESVDHLTGSVACARATG
jgi:CheY-like chemotaxis protein